MRVRKFLWAMKNRVVYIVFTKPGSIMVKHFTYTNLRNFSSKFSDWRSVPSMIHYRIVYGDKTILTDHCSVSRQLTSSFEGN